MEACRSRLTIGNRRSETENGGDKTMLSQLRDWVRTMTDEGSRTEPEETMGTLPRDEGEEAATGDSKPSYPVLGVMHDA